MSIASGGEGLGHKLIDHLVTQYGFRSPEKCQLYFRLFFGDVRLYDRSVLDIGCGKGWLSLYAAGQGASEVIGLEPMTDGSVSGDMDEFRRVADDLGVKNVTALPHLIQDYDAGGKQFDVILMRSAINHLDEEACVTLKKSEESRERYREVFRRLNSFLRLGGRMILSDVSCHNFFGSLGLRNPVAPTIEWEKHQSPYTWASLLGECGFGEPEIEWNVPSPLLPLGRLVRNPMVAYFFNSKFRLVVTKTAELAEPIRQAQ